MEQVLNELRTRPEILNVDETCNFLDIKKSYLYKLTHEKKLTHFTTGKKLYFDKKDLIHYLTRNRIEAQN